MNEHIDKLKAISELLMDEVNSIDRILPYMVTQYPFWDDADVADFKNILLANLAEVVEKINAL
jgi:uncharacterized protein with ATP-grasp and redox domains